MSSTVSSIPLEGMGGNRDGGEKKIECAGLNSEIRPDGKSLFSVIPKFYALRKHPTTGVIQSGYALYTDQSFYRITRPIRLEPRESKSTIT